MAKFFLYPFAIAGDKTAIPDPTDPGGAVSYQEGWTNRYQLELGVDSDALPIPRGQMNQLMYDITLGIQQYQTHGAPDWITALQNGGVAFPYAKYAIVRYDDGGGSGVKVYMSLTTANVTTPSTAGVPDPSWRVISDPEIPIGTTIEFNASSVPSNYLVEDGSAISRTTYAALFAVIGTTWGAGNGTTTFNIPDSRRKTAIGSGGTGTGVIGNTVGSTGGVEASSEIANHVHNGISGYTAVGVASGGIQVLGLAAGGNSAPFITADTAGSGATVSLIQPSNVKLKCIKYA